MCVNNLTYSDNGLSLTEQFEGCELTAYQDQVGVWTIGYGHTGPDVVSGLTITQDQAQDLLAQDVGSAAACVNNSVTLQLSQDEFDALVDFVFNLGVGAFKSSTLLIDLNSGNLTAAATQFDLWDHAGGAVVAGLLRRREAETALFETDTDDTAPQTA
ncbi:MAG TPA: lysozyme [Acidobacteriaceae bacterium]|jgi:lysozyme|nr:lysozyme [Acidobacteriaceae bacterium]